MYMKKDFQEHKMAIRIPLNVLTEKQIESVAKILKIAPEQKVSKFGKQAPKLVEPFDIFTIHQYDDEGNVISRSKENPDKEYYINIPFFIAPKLLGKEMVDKYRTDKKKYAKFSRKKHPYCENLRDDKHDNIAICRQELDEHGTTSIKLPPGTGKTIYGAVLAWIYGLRTIILLESVGLVTQHYNSFIRAIPSLKDSFWRVGEEPMPKNPMIIICMEERIKYVPPNILDGVGTLIIDEAHKFCTPSRVEPILSVRPKYIIIQTATLPRRDKNHHFIYAVAGTHGIFELAKKPHKVVIYDTGITIAPVKNRYGPDYGALQSELCEHELYTEMVMEFILNNPHRKFIVLTSLTRHVKKMVERANHFGIENDYLCDNKSTYSDSQVLFGTISKIGTGFDEATACANFKGKKSDTLILASSVKCDIPIKKIKDGENISKVYTDEELAEIARIEQIRGRVMRADNTPYIVYFSVNHPSHKKHIKGYTRWAPVVNGKVIHHNLEAEGDFIIPE